MQARLVNIGYGTIIAVDRIIAVVAPESAPIKRIVQEAKELKNLIDATYGRRTRSVIIMDNSTVILSAVQPETITNRVNMDIIKEKSTRPSCPRTTCARCAASVPISLSSSRSNSQAHGESRT